MCHSVQSLSVVFYAGIQLAVLVGTIRRAICVNTAAKLEQSPLRAVVGGM